MTIARNKAGKSTDDPMPDCCAENMRYGRGPCCEGVTGDEPHPMLDGPCDDDQDARERGLPWSGSAL